MAPKRLERSSLECFEWLPSELHYSRHVQLLMGLLAGRPHCPEAQHRALHSLLICACHPIATAPQKVAITNLFPMRKAKFKKGWQLAREPQPGRGSGQD